MTTIDEMDEFLNLEALGGAQHGTGSAPLNNGPDDHQNWDLDLDLNLTDKNANIGQQPQQFNDFSGFDIDPNLIGAGAMTMDPANMDLAFENAEEDDFSFSALQQFGEDSAFLGFDEQQNQQQPELGLQTGKLVPEMPSGMEYPADFWRTPEVPCVSCTLGGYSCKKIREGRFKGYCTSCVALSVDCSFGFSVPDAVNPGSTYAANSSGIPTEELHQPIPIQRTETPSRPPSNRSSSFDLTSLTHPEDMNNLSRQPSAKGIHDQAKAALDPPPPKIGARFSRESVRILKTWLTTHNRHPYPSDEEKELLQRKTGLNKTQITNWLANARRRGKVQTAPRSTSPHPGNWSTGPMDIPQRRGTPALETMNPLQRWEHSPPENEPASITAISRAVTASSSGVSSGKSSPFTYNYTDDGSGRSLCNQSSASSLGTSQSSNGSSGAYSYGSRNSWGSFGSAPFSGRGQRRRRRRRAAPQKTKDGRTELGAPLKTFQCTFCTETFRTKHDWQRHEKSLHLSLERWVCAPHGPRAVDPDGQLSCIYCGIANPDDAHIESHNHSTCQERSLEERTFYRKDHLNQHLRLVHNVKFMDWSMKSWKVATPEIRSRCGFCGMVMDSWTIRVDHLAEHFKTGYSMKDWQGDWGFDVPVLDMVENSIPPYLIHHERTSPYPYVASASAPESPRNAYELIKLELAYYDANHREQHGRPPTDEELMVEGCRIIFASETISLQGIATQVSWLRDLIMSSDELMRKARFGPLRGATENRMASLKINGKDNLFEQCPMEYQLHEFSQNKRLLGLTPMDYELQEEACRIVGRVEEVSTHPSDNVANWLLRVITSSTGWLAGFRRRAHLPSIEDIKDENVRSTDPNVVDSNIHTYTRLERELADFAKLQRAMGVEPTDEDLQRQARIIIYEFDDGWNQTAADNLTWLEAFKARHPPDGSSPPTGTSPSFSLQQTNPSVRDTPQTSTAATKSPLAPVGAGPNACYDAAAAAKGEFQSTGPVFLNDANCYRRLARELGRWVAATMSPNNPNSHVPSDAELQHQARWILYDEDDPWNQTAADNSEWLQRFKRSVGIIADSGPSLVSGDAILTDTTIPPNPNSTLSFQISNSRAGHESACHRYDKGTKIFISKPLEDALTQHAQHSVQTTGYLPCSESLRSKARQVTNTSTTPADDAELMAKFQRYLLETMPHARPAVEDDAFASVAAGGVGGEAGGKMDFLDRQASDEELMGMDFDMGGREHDRGVRLSGFGQ